MKKAIAIVLTFMLCFTSTVNVSAASKNISDLSGHWAEEVVTKWVEEDIINGYPDGTFQPDLPMTIAEFISIINRVYGYSEKSYDNYADVKEENWYNNDLAIAKHSSYMEWYQEKNLNPNNMITRQEVSAIIALVMDLEATKNLSEIKNFKDYSNISKWSMPYIDALIKESYLSGYPDKTIRATESITRAEVVTLLNGAVGKLVNKSGEYGSEKNQVVNGNMTISQDNVNLKNMTINGDLIIAKGVQKGEILLENVTVKGRILINGGSQERMTLNNTKAKKVVIKAKSKITLGENSEIEELQIKTESEGTDIVTKEKSKIKKIEANSKVDIKGKADIETVEINANHVNIEPKVDKVIVSKGVNNSGVVIEKPASSPSSGGSSGSSKSNEKSITNTIIGEILGDSIINVPKGTTVKALKDALTVSSKASKEILTATGGSAVANQATAQVTNNMVIQVTAQNGSKKEYSIQLKIDTPILSSEKEILSTNIGELSENSIINVLKGTLVKTFKDALTISSKANKEILVSSGGTVVSDQENTKLTDAMVVQITAEDGSKKEYSIQLKSDAPILSNEKEILSTTIGILGDGITDVPQGTTVKALKDALTISDKASKEILESGSVVENQETTPVMNTMVIEITAQDGSKKEYSIQMKVLDSGCVITAVSSKVGKLQGPYVYDISTKTTVKMLLEALTLSQGATVKVVNASNQIVSEDSKVEDTMKIVVTAENGVDKKEYTIKTFITIDTIEDLRNINGSDSQGKTYKLMKSLDFNSDDSYEDISNKTQADIANWNPINYFKGTFEGNGHTISHLTITGDIYGAGLFGRINGYARISNLILEDVDISGDDSYYVGALIGKVEFNKATVDSISISDCHVTGSVKGDEYVGGLIGYIEYPQKDWIEKMISDCSNKATIEGSVYVGGLVGSMEGNGFDKVWIADCHNDGNVTSTGQVQSFGNSFIGGIVGYNSRGYIESCYNTGNVKTTFDDAGGIAGGNWYGKITNCYNTGDVHGRKFVGGVAGEGNAAVAVQGSISVCYSTGNIIGESRVGGITGYAEYNPISNCYSTGSVTATDQRGGGIVGDTESNVRNCYSTGNIECPQDTAGIVGLASSTTTIQNCVAMNQRNNGMYRVVGYSVSKTKMINNYGYIDMPVSLVPISDTGNRHGGHITQFDKSAEPLLKWDFTGDSSEFKWVMEGDMNRPVLYKKVEGLDFIPLGSDDGKMTYLSNDATVTSAVYSVDSKRGSIVSGNSSIAGTKVVNSTTAISEFFANLERDPKAVLKVVSESTTIANEEDFNNATGKAENVKIENGDILAVKAENGRIKTYTIAKVIADSFSPSSGYNSLSVENPKLYVYCNMDVNTVNNKYARIFNASTNQEVASVKGTPSNSYYVIYNFNVTLEPSTAYYVLIDDGAIRSMNSKSSESLAAIDDPSVWTLATKADQTAITSTKYQIDLTNNTIASGSVDITTLRNVLTFLHSENISKNSSAEWKVFTSSETITTVNDFDNKLSKGDSDNLANGDFLAIKANDKVRVYSIVVLPTVTSTAESGLECFVDQMNYKIGKSISDMPLPNNKQIGNFLRQLVKDSSSTKWKVFSTSVSIASSSDFDNTEGKKDTDTLARGDKLVLKAENGTLNTYSIEVEAPANLEAVSFTPADDATDVARILSDIEVAFNMDVEVSTGSAIIYKESDDSIAAEISVKDVNVSVVDNVVTFTFSPAVELEFNTQYYIQIEADSFISKNDANLKFKGITNKTTWTFKTQIE